MTRIKSIYIWARDNEPPDWITLPCLVVTLGCLYGLVAILAEKVAS